MSCVVSDSLTNVATTKPAWPVKDVEGKHFLGRYTTFLIIKLSKNVMLCPNSNPIQTINMFN